MKKSALALTLLLVAAPVAANAEIKIGVSVSASGPAASLGIPQRNAITLGPKEIAGEPVTYIVLDDASDPTVARRNAERFVSQDTVDLILGSSTSPATLAMIEVAGKSKTPMISFGASRAIIFPQDDNRKWVFKTPFNDVTTAAATVNDMKARNVKTVATIAFNDAYGEGWVNEFAPLAKAAGIELVAQEKFNPKDTSVTAQVLKVISVRPDAVLVAASGTPGALPQIALSERGYGGKVYQTTGVVNAEFLRIGGKALEGTLVAADPISVAMQLPEGHPAKNEAVTFATSYNASFGENSVSAFSGYAWDAILISQAAISKVTGGARPGTAQFRAALREAIETSTDVQTTAGQVTMTATDHNGFAADAPIIIRVTNGTFSVAH